MGRVDVKFLVNLFKLKKKVVKFFELVVFKDDVEMIEVLFWK